MKETGKRELMDVEGNGQREENILAGSIKGSDLESGLNGNAEKSKREYQGSSFQDERSSFPTLGNGSPPLSSILACDLKFNRYIGEANIFMKEAKECLKQKIIDDGLAEKCTGAARDADKVFLAAIAMFMHLMHRARLRPRNSREKMKLPQQAKCLYEDSLHMDSGNALLQEALSSCVSELNYCYS
ncbi:unnamed protein product [Fraxinus pennsylvanica]|uniref:Uncharacterized protein n=1 Tax=Fraxinus pennsylvanica TaxID=56036 RepID=A0AAD1YTX6_9LAMI|nr:unnamed protein product [Fraxinus pennsylvanica]